MEGCFGEVEDSIALKEHLLGFVEKDFEFEDRSTWRRRSSGGRRCSGHFFITIDSEVKKMNE
ncbi:hypothetical protein Tco_0545526, partial [Tanacetum coccineum]